MIVIDSTVWIDFFAGRESPQLSRLRAALTDEDEVAVAPVILTEVLQGFRSDRAFERARALLVELPRIGLDTEGHVAAAQLYRSLRRKGVTVRGAIDCMIAQTCIRAGAELLTSDGDFLAIARHSELRLCPAVA